MCRDDASGGFAGSFVYSVRVSTLPNSGESTVNAPPKRVIEKFNPATGDKIADYQICSTDEVNEAVARARAAAPAWAALTVKERLARLQAVRKICVRDAEEIARRISLDTGKPYSEALMHEVLAIPMFLDHYDKLAPKVLQRHKERTPMVFPGKSSYLSYFPMGVIAIISPWNFPFRLSMAPIISALIAGNTVVLKPSEVTPETGEVIRELFDKANLGPGVVEVCQGDGSTGAALCEADVDKIFFTGSVATGRKVMAAAAKKPIPVELELGGKDAHIILRDADLDRAAQATAWAGLMNCGQMCTSAERIIVEEAVHDEFVKKLEAHVRAIQVGGPDDDADMGPMCFRPQLDTVEAHLADAREQGADIVVGGERIDRPGQFFEPTLITGVTVDMEIWKEETFGPVIPVIKARDAEHAIELCNEHQYGLSGAIWTEDRDRGLDLACRMECGQVMVNDAIQITGNPALPFGGVKNSGIGRYHGAEGLLTFSHTRAVMVDQGFFRHEPVWFPYRDKYPIFKKAFDALLGGNMPRAFIYVTKLRKLSKK